MIRFAVLIVIGALACVCQPRTGVGTQKPSMAESTASCSIIDTAEPRLDAFGLAQATLKSLWYARAAAERSKDIAKVTEDATNMLSLMTGLMRVNKTGINDFQCAKRSLRPLNSKGVDENIRLTASYLITLYEAHVTINERMNPVIQKLDSFKPSEMSDELSTLQVERSQRWADLVQPVSMALLLLVDTKRTDDPNKTTRLVITKAEKAALLDWIGSRFPEFSDGTPKDKWSDPVKTAQLYFTMLSGRKCSDE